MIVGKTPPAPSPRRTTQAKARATALPILILGLTLGLGSCSWFKETVSRPIKVLWSPDGTELLVVTSLYDTSKPDEPYFNATKGSNWRISLARAPYTGDPAAPLGPRTTIDHFVEPPEGLVQGGRPEYSGAWWIPDLPGVGPVVVFGGPGPWVRYLDAGRTWMVPSPRGTLATAVASGDPGPDNLSPAQIAAWLDPVDAIPSPDGRSLAVLYWAGVNYRTFWSYQFRVVGFYDLATGARKGLVRVSPRVWSDTLAWEAFGVGTDGTFTTTLAWAPDGSGVYLPQRGNEIYETEAPDLNEVRFISLTTLDSQAVSEVPAAFLPSPGGLAGPDGLLATLAFTGNQAALRPSPWPTAFGPWVHHQDQAPTTVDVDWWNRAFQRHGF